MSADEGPGGYALIFPVRTDIVPYYSYMYISHKSSLFRPTMSPIHLRSFIEHSYSVYIYPIWVSMKCSRHFNVYWSSKENRPYSGLDVYFDYSTLFRPRTTPMRLLSFIAHSYVMPWEPIWVSMKGSRHFNIYFFTLTFPFDSKL